MEQLSFDFLDESHVNLLINLFTFNAQNTTTLALITSDPYYTKTLIIYINRTPFYVAFEIFITQRIP